MNHFILEAEGLPAIESPAWAEVEMLLHRLSKRGPGFLSLTHSGGGYAQAAGTSIQMIVEVREIAGDGNFAHYVLGEHSHESKMTSVRTNAGTIQLRSNEVLSAVQAVQIFQCFFEQKAIPETFTRRDITQIFKAD